MHPRIDERGQYCPLPGTTVVSAIQASDTEFWRTVYNQLKSSPTICHYYAPLPYTSYHMTCFALDTIDNMLENEDWTTFINKKTKFYSELHNALSTQQILPNIRFGLLSEVNGMVLEVRLPQEQVSAIQKIAEQYDCEAGIPLCFHITLAYQYKSLIAEDHPKIIEELKPLSRIFKQKKNTTLNPPKLCYFNDMTRFILWNGSTNPFIMPSFSSSLYGFYNAFKEILPSAPSCLSCCPKMF